MSGNQAVVARTEFAVPAVPGDAASLQPRKRKRKVLEEDEYVGALEKIIQRDFFPDLPKLRAQLEYLTALEENDFAKVQDISRRYQTPGPAARGGAATPAGFETPASFDGALTPASGVAPGHTAATANTSAAEQTEEEAAGMIDTDLSLDAFLSRYTSEDNESFEEILEAAKERLRSRYAWAYERTHKQERQLALTQGDQERKAIERARGQYMAIESWRYTPHNALMYPPTGLEPSASELVAQAKRKREIKHSSTRFKTMPFPETLVAGSSTGSTVAGGIPSAVVAAVAGSTATGSDSPRVRGYGFVTTPSPMPGVDHDPAMTWGVIEGTPFLLDGSDTPRDKLHGPHFTISKPSRRDQLTHQMVDKIRAKQRKQEQESAASAAAARHSTTPRSVRTTPTARLAQMSPAAQRMVKGMSLSRNSSLSTALRASYDGTTPQAVAAASDAVPSSVASLTDAPVGEGSSITDNLL